MLARALAAAEEPTACCSSVYCKCLNVRIDFINQSSSNDNNMIIPNDNYEYQQLERSLDSQSGINSTLYFRAFLLSINIKFKWLIGCTIIYDKNNPKNKPLYLYKCHSCSYDLFLSTSNILGKCLINYELQNFDKSHLEKRSDFSSTFNIIVDDDPGSIIFNNISSIFCSYFISQNRKIAKMTISYNCNIDITQKTELCRIWARI